MKITFVAIIILLLGFCALGYMHEDLHVEIFRHHGVDSHVEYFSHFPDLVTVPEGPCPTEMCLLAQNNADSIAYPIMVLYSVFGLFIFIIICLLDSFYQLQLYKLEED